MNLVIYPNPVLKERSIELEQADLEAVKLATPKMIEIMHKYKGVGLAAVQVGILRRFAVLDMTKDAYYDPLTPAVITLINPEIVEQKNHVRLPEGCLSLPLFQETLDRYADIKVRYRDENWVEHTRDFSGSLAQCVQHELEHLDGELILEEVSLMKKQMYLKKLRKKGIL